MADYISREAALKDFESCNAENPNWTPTRVKTLLIRQPAAVPSSGRAIRCSSQPAGPRWFARKASGAPSTGMGPAGPSTSARRTAW